MSKFSKIFTGTIIAFLPILGFQIYQNNLHIKKISNEITLLESAIKDNEVSLAGTSFMLDKIIWDKISIRLEGLRKKSLLSVKEDDSISNIYYDDIDYYNQNRIDDLENRLNDAEQRAQEAEDKARDAQFRLDDMENDKIVNNYRRIF